MAAVRLVVQLSRQPHNGPEHSGLYNAVFFYFWIASLVCVLLVEDEPLIREIMSESLRDAGYDVVEAADGVQAVSLMAGAAKPISILVTDFHMPGGLDGAQVAARVRAMNAELPVVIATGRPDVMQQSWRDDLGYALLRKPYLARELLTLVHDMVGEPPRPGLAIGG